MSDQFKQWLAEELEEQGLSGNELARRMEYSSGGISATLSPGGTVSWNFAYLAATKLPDTRSFLDAFVRAGFVSEHETQEAIALSELLHEEDVGREIARIVRGLSSWNQQMALHLVRSLAAYEQRSPEAHSILHG